MADTLEAIELEIKHSASGADAEISKVTKSLSSLGKVISSVLPKLEKLAVAFEEIAGKGTPITFNDNHTTQVAETINNVKQAATRAQKATVDAASGVKTFRDNLKSASGPLGNFLSSLKRIAMYRFLRTIIKNITQGFSEGLKNAYHWSLQFSKSLDGSLAQSLDNLSSKSLTMKNQMGAAFGALLQAIMPVVLQIISLITRLMQALSALFAAIGGGQYLIAKEVAKGWDEATGGAKEYKKTLLGFDEINRLDDNSGGGGGGTSGLADMFQEGELPKWAQWIADHLEEIKTLAEAIGIAIAAWKIGSFITDLLGVETGAKTLLGIAMAISGAFLLAKGAIDAFNNGVDWTNLFEMISGAALLAGGLAIAFGKVGGAVGLLVGGLTLLITGIMDWIKTGELSTESFVAIETGIIMIGTAIALLTGSWIPLLIAAVVGIVVAIVTHWDEIKQWTIETWEKVKEWTIKTWEKIKEKVSEISEKTKQKIVEIWGKIKTFFTQTIPEIVTKVGAWFGELPGKVGYALGFALGKITAWGSEAYNYLKEKIPEIVESVKEWFGKLPGKIKEKFDEVHAKFEEWKNTASNWVTEKIPEVVNSIVQFFEELPTKLFNIGSNMLSSLWDGTKTNQGRKKSNWTPLAQLDILNLLALQPS